MEIKRNALPKDMKSADAILPKQGLVHCNKLFEIEKKLKDLSSKDRKQQRLKLAKPVLEAFWSWVDSNINGVLTKSKIGQALQYVKNQQSGLMVYLEDGNCEISNNLAENSIRPFIVGRKNWLFAGSPKGAIASATVYCTFWISTKLPIFSTYCKWSNTVFCNIVRYHTISVF